MLINSKYPKYSKILKHLLSTIKRCYNQNKNQIIFKTVENNDLILSKLIKFGYIQSYKKYNKFYYIQLKKFNYFYNKSDCFFNYESRYTSKNKITLKFLTTDKGILTNYEILEKNIGGKFLFAIK
jgi:ribosomal protein S8